MSRVIAVMACGFTLAACSTSLPSLNFLHSAPQTEALRIESEPPGAEAKTSLGQTCRTPCELPIQAGSEFSLTLALNGYQPQTVSVRPEVSPQAATPRLAPNPVYAELQPATAAPPRKPLKKKKPVATAAGPAASSPVASAETPAPAPAAAVPTPAPGGEPAASATNFPWPSR